MVLELTGDEIVNTLIMEREAGDTRLTLLVEGEEDCALIDIHIEPKLAKTHMSGSKTAVLAAADLCNDEGISWALCIIDADFDRYTGVDATWPSNVLASRHCDLLIDTVLAAPEKLSSAAITLGRPGAVREFEKSVGRTITEYCLATSRHVGALREAVIEGRFQMTVRKFPLSGVTQAGASGDVLDFVAQLACDRAGNRYPVSEFRSEIQTRLSSVAHNSPRYYNGHDFVATLRDALEYCSSTQISKDSVYVACRLAISCDGFVSLSVVQEIRRWASVLSVDPFRCQAA